MQKVIEQIEKYRTKETSCKHKQTEIHSEEKNVRKNTIEQIKNEITTLQRRILARQIQLERVKDQAEFIAQNRDERRLDKLEWNLSELKLAEEGFLSAKKRMQSIKKIEKYNKEIKCIDQNIQYIHANFAPEIRLNITFENYDFFD